MNIDSIKDTLCEPQHGFPRGSNSTKNDDFESADLDSSTLLEFDPSTETWSPSLEQSQTN